MTNPYTSGRLLRLSDADYEVAPDDLDVRGWKVLLPTNDEIGRVDDLIIEPAAGKVRYLDVDLNRKALGLERNRHILIPVASAQLDATDKCLVLSGMTRATVLNLPEYTQQTFDPDYENTYRSHLRSDAVSKRLTRSAEELRIGKRVEKQGEVRVTKHVETERVRQDVPLRAEEVHVERRPVERTVGSRAEFRDDEVVVPVMEEQAVIEKRPVVKEEVVISKQPVTKHQTIETDVRHEEIDVDRTAGRGEVKQDDRRKGGR